MSSYNTYRGRSPFKRFLKILLLILLIMCLLAVGAFFYLQKYITYSANGIEFNPPFLNNTSSEPTATPPPATVPIIIASPEPTAVPDFELFQLHALFLSPSILTDSEQRTGVLAEMDRLGTNAFIIDMKQTNGTLSYSSALPNAIAAQVSIEDPAIIDTITELLSMDSYAVARISCFRDNLYARANPYLALTRSTGSLWYDSRSKAWLNPYNADARRYLVDVAVELAKMGFNEILLDDLSFPTNGRTSRIAYDDVGNVTQINSIDAFIDQMKDALAPYHVVLSVVAGDNLTEDRVNENSGQCLTDLLLRVDRLYVCANEEDIGTLSAIIEVASVSTADPLIALVPVMAQKPTVLDGNWAIKNDG